MGSYQPISRVAIIGAGPTGIAFAKYLLAEKCFEIIEVFEQRDRVGGVWNLSQPDRTQRIPIPQTDPYYGSQDPYKTNDDDRLRETPADSTNDSLEFESPLYDYLETNIPKTLMQYSDTPFPENYPLFPSHQEVLQYLENYAEEVRHLVKFNTQVQNVKLLGQSFDATPAEWQVTTKDLECGTMSDSTYDAIVVASGHYTIPSVPDIPGLSDWHLAYPGSVIHSKAYRRPEGYAGKNVLVIGNSASGLDIAAQIGQYSKNLFLSGRSESIFGQTLTSWREDIDEVVEFLPTCRYDRAVKTKSGKVIEKLDIVIFSTGYFYSFPFMSSYDPASATGGLRAGGMYQHLISIRHPTLAFPVLNLKVIPFGLAENQAAVVARIWSGRLRLPSQKNMNEWEEQVVAKNGNGKYFHVKKYPEDGEQMNELYRWAMTATPSNGLDNEGHGKVGMMWNENQFWMRKRFPAIKKAYTEHGNDRRKIKSLEDLGFVFETWKEQASKEEIDQLRQTKDA